MALLWSKRILGGASLPMSVGQLRAYTDRPPTGSVSAILTGTVKGRDRAVSNIVFRDEEGTVVAELRDVVTVLRPGEPALA